jgi:hypothetical protein
MYQALVKEFGDSQVFWDRESLKLGGFWRQDVDRALEATSIVLVLIDHHWLQGFLRRRSERTVDEVRRELLLAKRLGKQRWPVLLNVPMFSEAEARLCCEADSELLEALLELRSAQFFRALPNVAPKRLLTSLSGYCVGIEAEIGARIEKESIERLRKLSAKRSTAPFERPALHAALASALASDARLVVISGEEGMGKSTALVECLTAISLDRTIFLRARDDIWKKPSLNDVLKSIRKRIAAGSKTIKKSCERLSLRLVVDGINEAASVDWRHIIERCLDQEESGVGQLVITVRAGYWADLKIAEKPLCTVPVEGLDEPEFCEFCTRLSIPQDKLQGKVREALKRPRMLMAAAKISAEQLADWEELSYDLLRLLDLKQASSQYRELGFDEFWRVIRNLAPVSELSRFELSNTLGEFGDQRLGQALRDLRDAQITRSSDGKFQLRDDWSRIAFAICTLTDARCTSASFDEIIEHLKTRLGDQDDFARAEALESMVSIARCAEGFVSKLTIQALFYLWLCCVNRKESVQYSARGYLPDLLDLVELCHERNVMPYELDKFVANSLLLSKDSWLQLDIRLRFASWFSTVCDEDLQLPASMTRADLADLGIRTAPRAQSALRRFGLRVAAFAALPSDLECMRALCLSLSVQWHAGFSTAMTWARSSTDNWWPHLHVIWQSHQKQAVTQFLKKTLQTLWPTEEATQVLGKRKRFIGRSGPDEVSLASLRKPNTKATIAQLQKLGQLCSPTARNDHVRHEHYGLAGQYHRIALEEAIERDVELITRDEVGGHFYWPHRSAFTAPLLSYQQRKRLRKTMPSQVRLRDVRQASCVSLMSWWLEPPARRLQLALRDLDLVNSDREIIECLELDGDLFDKVIYKLRQSKQRSKLLFLLNRANCRMIRAEKGGEARAKASFKSWLLKVTPESLDQVSQYWAMQLACRFKLMDVVAKWVPTDWRYEPDKDTHIAMNWVYSYILAHAPNVSASEKLARCCEAHAVYIKPRTAAEIDSHAAATIRWINETHQNQVREEHLRMVMQVDPTLSSVKTRHFDVLYAMEQIKHPGFAPALNSYLESYPYFPLRVNKVDAKYLLAFKLKDGGEARAIWQRLINEVQNDSQLLQLIWCAQSGDAKNWLRTQAQDAPVSSIPNQIARFAMICAMAGFTAHRRTIKKWHAACDGWLASALALALQRMDRYERAKAWLRKFRGAEDWYKAIGAWRLHLDFVDLRLRYATKIVKDRAYAMRELMRYEQDFESDRENAIEKDLKSLEKTRFGLGIGR